MNLLQEAMIALLSGLTIKTGNEIHWTDADGAQITIEPIDIEQNEYIIRHYYENGKKHWEIGYRNGQLHGKYIIWYENGQKHWEENWKDGEQNGGEIHWYKSGSKYYERNYLDGQLHGKYIGWFENGKKYWELKYKNGRIIEPRKERNHE